MTPLFKKLNLKDQRLIHVLRAPPSLEPELAQLEGVELRRHLGKAERTAFALAFVQTRQELDAVSALLAASAQGDAILWLAYPKGTSKRYRCDFNRDSGWDVLQGAGYESVRMVAIDEDWSALRFRKSAYMKSSGRKPAPGLADGGNRTRPAK
jgi:hypothetical protein